MPDELLVFLTAMTPIGELRAAVPWGLTRTDLSWPAVYVLAVAGNLVPVPLIIVALRAVGERMEQRQDLLGRLIRWRTLSVQARWGDRVARHGFLGVMLIVAIPLPLTGAWTGSLAVWALRVPVRRGLAAIAAGVLLAGAIVTAGVELYDLSF